MPITIKSTELKYKNPSTGQYQGIDVIAETTTSQQCALIEAKGAETIASIPSDYTTLSDTVDDLSSDVSNLNGAIKRNTFAVKGTLKSGVTASGNIFNQSTASDGRITSDTEVANVIFDSTGNINSGNYTVTPGNGTVTITGTTRTFSETVNVVIELYNT